MNRPWRRSSYFEPTETVRRLRPFIRLRRKTSRPPRVFIRARNPCFLSRLIRLGWYVRFIPTAPGKPNSSEAPRMVRVLEEGLPEPGTGSSGPQVSCSGARCQRPFERCLAHRHPLAANRCTSMRVFLGSIHSLEHLG